MLQLLFQLLGVKGQLAGGLLNPFVQGLREQPIFFVGLEVFAVRAHESFKRFGLMLPFYQFLTPSPQSCDLAVSSLDFMVDFRNLGVVRIVGTYQVGDKGGLILLALEQFNNIIW